MSCYRIIRGFIIRIYNTFKIASTKDAEEATATEIGVGENSKIPNYKFCEQITHSDFPPQQNIAMEKGEIHQ